MGRSNGARVAAVRRLRQNAGADAVRLGEASRRTTGGINARLSRHYQPEYVRAQQRETAAAANLLETASCRHRGVQSQ